MNFPSGLQDLIFGDGFNCSLERVSLPNGLQSLTFGERFDQSLDLVKLPMDLKSLTLGYCFDQKLEHVNFPSGLQMLTFGCDFDQSLEGVNLPENLQDLTFGFYFNQSMDNVKLPEGLQSLTFGHHFNQSLSLPKLQKLQNLTLGDKFDQPSEPMVELQSLWINGKLLEQMAMMLFCHLQSLTIAGGLNGKVKLPSGLESFLVMVMILESFFRFFCKSCYVVCSPQGKMKQLNNWIQFFFELFCL